MAEEDNSYRLSSRKFIVTLLGTLLATGMLVFDKISGGEYVAIILGLAGGYITGNVLSARK